MLVPETRLVRITICHRAITDFAVTRARVGGLPDSHQGFFAAPRGAASAGVGRTVAKSSHSSHVVPAMMPMLVLHVVASRVVLRPTGDTISSVPEAVGRVKSATLAVSTSPSLRLARGRRPACTGTRWAIINVGVNVAHSVGTRRGYLVLTRRTFIPPADLPSFIHAQTSQIVMVTTPPHPPTRNHAVTLSIIVAPIVGHIISPSPTPASSRAKVGGTCPQSAARPLVPAGACIAWLIALAAASMVVRPVLPAAAGILGLRLSQRTGHSVPTLPLARHAMTRNRRTRTQPRPTGVVTTDVMARAPCHTHENGATDGTNDSAVLINGTWCVSLVKCNVPMVTA